MHTKKLLTILLLSTGSLFAQIPTAGLLSAWTFSGNANDISGNGNNGVAVGGANLTTDRFGNANAAYNFNGSTSYLVMMNPGPTGSVSRSVSFWAKTSSSSLMAAFDYGTIMVGGCFHILFNYNCPGIGFDVAGGIMTRGTNAMADNAWHHYAAVYDANISTQMNNVMLYVDGVLQPNVSCWVTSTVTTLGTGSADPITIGRTAGAATRYYDGSLDDFYFYNRALTQTEVLDLKNYAPCGNLAAPAAISGNTTVCSGSSHIYGIAPVNGATGYVWQLPNGWTGSSITNSIVITVPNTIGTLSVAATNSCGTSAYSTLLVNATNAVPQLSVNSSNSLSCRGTSVALAANGASSYTWQPGNLTGFQVSVSPTVSTNYTVTGSNNGCFSSTVKTQSVQVCNGIGIDTKMTGFKIFPNPANELLTITCEERGQFSIYNSMAELCLQAGFESGTSEVSLLSLKPGIYTLLYQAQTNSSAVKLIKR